MLGGAGLCIGGVELKSSLDTLMVTTLHFTERLQSPAAVLSLHAVKLKGVQDGGVLIPFR